MRAPEEIIRIVFTEEDVRDIAFDLSIPADEALERAREWGKHIESTALQLCDQQLTSVIELGTP